VKASAQPTTTELGPVLGSKSMAQESVNGEKWYSFQALRSGTVSVSAAATGGEVHLNLFSESYALMQNAAPAGQPMVTAAVTEGETYMVRVIGSASVDLKVSNSISEFDRLDTTRDGKISPRDVLVIVNELLWHGSHHTPMEAGNYLVYLDTTLDGNTTAADALEVINYLLLHGATIAAPAAGAAAPLAAAAPVMAVPAAAVDGTQSAMAAALAAPATSDTIEPAAADLVLAELPDPTITAGSAPAIDAAWSDGASWLADDEADEDNSDAE
jgi:hypothetical protein